MKPWRSVGCSHHTALLCIPCCPWLSWAWRSCFVKVPTPLLFRDWHIVWAQPGFLYVWAWYSGIMSILPTGLWRAKRVKFGCPAFGISPPPYPPPTHLWFQPHTLLTEIYQLKDLKESAQFILSLPFPLCSVVAIIPPPRALGTLNGVMPINTQHSALLRLFCCMVLEGSLTLDRMLSKSFLNDHAHTHRNYDYNS